MRLFRSDKISSQPDAEIIDRYKCTGDKNLIGILFNRHAHLVYGICYHYLKNETACKDAVLTIFEKLFEDLLKYEVHHFSSWIHSVARNYCFALLNREKEKTGLHEVYALYEEDDDPEEKQLMEKKPA